MGFHLGIGLGIGDSLVGAAGVAGQPLITAQTPGAPRNNFDGSLGFRFTVGGANITVTALGRWVTAGNSLAHIIRLFSAATPTELGNVSVNTNGAPAGAYLYATLGSPIILTAGVEYAVLSDEINTFDQFNDTGVVTANAVVTINGSAYRTGLSGGAGVISTGAAGSSSYGPCNLRYQ